MAWLGWVMFALMGVWYVASQSFSHRKRLHIRNYIVFLLIDRRMAEDHHRKFADWIRESNASSALDLSSRADRVIENMADDLAGEARSTLAAHALLWNCEAASELRRGRSSHAS